MKNYTCKYCSKELASKSSLNNHISNAQYCINKRENKEEVRVFNCNDCQKKFTSKQSLILHISRCSTKTKNEYEYKTTQTSDQYEEKLSFLQEELQKKDKLIQQLQDKLENIAIKAVQRNFEDETIIEIDDTLSESQFTVDESESETDEVEDYKLTPLEVGQGYTIEHREEDGYINVTNLCKAGGKQFKAWKRLDKTKAFLQVLSSEVLIHTSDLIKLGNSTFGNKGEQQVTFTWVHPQIAINIAQWISPQFDVKVSGWVYEIMITGKVDITNTKTYKELQKENKDHKIKIQYLTKKYVKAQPRVQYEEKNLVYILTTKLMKKDRRYILGKATNLTSRLSTYNKSDEHEVVYYASCEDEETMSCVETMVFQYLNEYREQANRERFILPEKKEISFFSDVINKSVEFFKK